MKESLKPFTIQRRFLMFIWKQYTKVGTFQTSEKRSFV